MIEKFGTFLTDNCKPSARFIVLSDHKVICFCEYIISELANFLILGRIFREHKKVVLMTQSPSFRVNITQQHDIVVMNKTVTKWTLQ